MQDTITMSKKLATKKSHMSCDKLKELKKELHIYLKSFPIGMLNVEAFMWRGLMMMPLDKKIEIALWLCKFQ